MSSARTIRLVNLSRAREGVNPQSPGAAFWIVLCVAALVVRLLAAFYLPNAEQDGYSDAETIARLSASLASGQFRLADLYGFWLPCFQFVAAVPNIWLRDPLLAGKIVSSLCGAASCVLTFAIAYRLTHRVLPSCVAFVLVLLNPLHILYSAACMTDVPFGFLTLASLWFLLEDRWLAAAFCAALAGSVRVEAWALIPLLPCLQFIRQRRVSFLVCAVLIFPPLAWLVVSQMARGDWFAFFTDRVLYHAHYMDFHPSRRGFAMTDVRGDIEYLLLGANRVVFFASVVSGVLLLVEFLRRRRTSWACFATVSYFLAVMGLLVAAYVTKRQPVWLPRYGLVALVLGLPLMAWLVQRLIDHWKPAWLGWSGAVAMILASVWSVKPQLPIIPKVLNDFHAHSMVADALVADLEKSEDHETRCFSDDVAVRVLSGLPASRFVGADKAPREAWDNVELFEKFLREKHVAYVVYMPTEDSLPVKLYPELGRGPPSQDGRFQLMTYATSSFGPDVWLYRTRF
jgi:hypothetical protein